jgi:hypothetical protein
LLLLMKTAAFDFVRLASMSTRPSQNAAAAMPSIFLRLLQSPLLRRCWRKSRR